MATRRWLRLGVSLDGLGRHPAAWRTDGADPAGAFTLAHLARAVALAEQGGLHFVTLDDGFGLQPGGEAAVRGRLDALLALAAVAPSTRSIGLVPMTDTTHTEPFNLAKNLATLDLVSAGRAGWWPNPTTAPEAAALFGRKPAPSSAEAWAETEDVIDVVRRLWDSWEDDAVIRDVATGRYVDREKLHYVDFEGRFFSVRGPSITPRSPQGQPVVFMSGEGAEAMAVAASQADVVVVDVGDAAEAARVRTDLRRRVAEAGRDPDDVALVTSIEAHLADELGAALAGRAELDDLSELRSSDRFRFTGTPAGLADVVASWFEREALDGVLVRPSVVDQTLPRLGGGTVPGLVARGLVAPPPADALLRTRFGLGRPASRYAARTAVAAGAEGRHP